MVPFVLFWSHFGGEFGVEITPTPFKHLGLLCGPYGYRKLESYACSFSNECYFGPFLLSLVN